MSEINNKHIKNFVDGHLSELERKETVDQINSYNNKLKMKASEKFNAEKAWERFAERINENEKQLNRGRKIQMTRTLKYAASVILIVGLTIISYIVLNSDKKIEIASNEKIIEHRLPDGSVITLNNGSTLSYNKSFRGDTRNVQFSGEAYFDIAKDPNKPFVIQTNGAEIKVLGTEFNVKTDNGNTQVTVTEGKVSLTDRTDNESVILNVGDKGEISKGIVKGAKNNDRNFLSWKTKNLYFEQGEMLKDVFSDLERTYNVSIEFDEDSLGTKMISKHEFNNVELSYILDLFGPVHDFTYQKEGDKIILVQKSE